MSGTILKKHLLRIASQIHEETTLAEVYEQLAMLEDIEQSERDIETGKVISNEELKIRFQ
ncbi:MAG: hypothetical protein AB8F95_04025 [Bacteroidia bacterium]